MIYGITGKSGAGKTTIAKTEYSWCKHINIDEIGHEAMDLPHVKTQLIKVFGDDILDKKKRADIVFNSREAYKQL